MIFAQDSIICRSHSAFRSSPEKVCATQRCASARYIEHLCNIAAMFRISSTDTWLFIFTLICSALRNVFKGFKYLDFCLKFLFSGWYTIGFLCMAHKGAKFLFSPPRGSFERDRWVWYYADVINIFGKKRSAAFMQYKPLTGNSPLKIRQIILL